MEEDGYAPGESIAFDFENGSGTYTYQGKIAGSFVSAGTYLVIPEGVYRSMNPRGTAYGYLWVDCDKKDVASVEQSLNTLISKYFAYKNGYLSCAVTICRIRKPA